jgi:hypothetical protein
VPILVSSTPPAPTTPVEPIEPKVRDEPTLIWQGWTGDEWVLAGNRDADTFVEQDGLGGILEPTVQHYFVENTGDGSSYQGHRYPAREVQVPIFVWGDTPSEMRLEDKRFRATLRPEKQATLLVAEPNGLRRWINLRYLSGAEGSFSGDTYGKHWIRYTLTLTAEDPFYYGDPETIKFQAGTATDFFGGGTAPSFNISNSRTINTAKLLNVGDEPTYLEWFVHGSMTNFEATGVGVIELPLALSSAQSVQVFTDPRDGRIVDQNGTNRWPDAGEIQFLPLQPGVETDLAITVDDGDSNTFVEVSYQPKYRSAW